MGNDKVDKTLVRTPIVTLSYPKLDKPHAIEADQTPKYSVDILIKKSESIDELKEACRLAAVAKFGPKENWPKGMKTPIKDGDAKDGNPPEYAGCWYITARNERKPTLRARDGVTNLEGRDFWGGCQAKCIVQAFGYSKVNKGVSFSLQGVQFIGEGTRFGGSGGNCDEMFENFDDGSENPDNYAKDEGGPDDEEKAPF